MLGIGPHSSFVDNKAVLQRWKTQGFLIEDGEEFTTKWLLNKKAVYRIRCHITHCSFVRCICEVG